MKKVTRTEYDRLWEGIKIFDNGLHDRISRSNRLLNARIDNFLNGKIAEVQAHFDKAVSELTERIRQQEVALAEAEKELNFKLRDQAVHLRCAATGHSFAPSCLGLDITTFRCAECGLEYTRANTHLTPHEKELVEVTKGDGTEPRGDGEPCPEGS